MFCPSIPLHLSSNAWQPAWQFLPSRCTVPCGFLTEAPPPFLTWTFIITLYSTIQVLSLLPRLFGSIAITRTVYWVYGHICITRWHQLVFGGVKELRSSFYRLNCLARNPNFVTRLPIELQGRILAISRVGKSERNHKNSQHFRPCAFLFISLIPQWLMELQLSGNHGSRPTQYS